MLSICNAGKDSWESLGKQDQTSQSYRKSTLNIHWKDWCWSWSSNTWSWSSNSDANSWLIRKDPDAGKDWRQEEKRATEDETVGWHHQFNGYQLGRTLGDGEGPEGLVCCRPWGREELDTTWRLNNHNLKDPEMAEQPWGERTKQEA